MKNKKEETIENLLESFSEKSRDFFNSVDAEMNHGNGFDTERDRKDFIDYFTEKLDKVNNSFEKIKIKLKEL